ncbi:hypothetical protein LOZ66_004147 [Ophidiomyces ophidiicola]|nr:hypothetical protein LOZ66_004147 [Ophidiomyces ophidiicola]
MVKADVRKDYYAELGLDARAEPEEIRKQYRKLALKYHPDRNPGREAESNGKFQGLQTAYEILNDPLLRTKYDTDRIRTGYGKHYSAQRTTTASRTQNPTSPFTTNTSRKTTTSYSKSNHPSAVPFPPPPPPPPTSTSQKRSSYAKPGTPNWDDARTRADAYRGFQNMKQSSHTAGGWTNFDPRTGRSSHEAGRADRPTPKTHSQRPHSAYESYFTNPRSGSTSQRSHSAKKKNGFAPGTPGGDEPMAKGTSAYASVLRGERGYTSNPYFDTAPSPTAKKKFAEDEPATSIPNLERTSSKYATSGGEKTYFSSTGLGHGSGVRPTFFDNVTSRPRTNPPSPTASPNRGRHHSASPKVGPNRNRAFSSSSASSDSDQVLPSFRPKAIPRSRIRNNRQKVDPSGDHVKENVTGEPSWGWAMHADSWLFDKTGNETPKYPSASNPSGFYNWAANCNPHQGMESEKTCHTSQGSENVPVPGNSPIPTESSAAGQHNDKATSDRENVKASARCDSSNQTPKSRDAHRATPKSKSHDYISTTFSAEEWNGTFGNGVHFFVPDNGSSDSKPMRTRGRTLSKPDLSPNFQSSNPLQETTNSNPDRSSSQPVPPFAEAIFSADRWAELLRDNTWTVPHIDISQPPADPRRQKSPKKTIKSKRSTVPRPARVTTEVEEIEATYTAKTNEVSNSNTTGATEAMDIDEASPAGNVKPAEVPTSKESANSLNTKIQDPVPDLLDLTDIGLVNPLTATNTGGLDDLKDLNSTLPFDSQPSVDNNRIKPKDLALPKPPKQPVTPKFTVNPGVSNLSPEHIIAQTLWNRYMAEMAAYMNEWNRFNRTMLSHFNARQNFVDTVLSPNWMNARGDSGHLSFSGTQTSGIENNTDSDNENCIGNSAKHGFSAYVRGMEEDFVVRQHWEVAWERHRQCILELGRLRTWIREGRKLQPPLGNESLI